MFPSLIFLYQSHFIFTFEYCYHLVPSLSPTILDKINGKPRPPSPPPPIQGWQNGAFLPFVRLHPWFGGGGGWGFAVPFYFVQDCSFPSPWFLGADKWAILKSDQPFKCKSSSSPPLPRQFLFFPQMCAASVTLHIPTFSRLSCALRNVL